MPERDDVPSLRLDPKRERACYLISRGRGKAETSRDAKVRVSESTMHRWCDDPVFQARVEALRTSVDRQATEILQDSLTNAARAVSDIVAGKSMAVGVACDACGADVTAAVVADQRLRQRMAQWLLEMHYKGKIPDAGAPGGDGPADGDGDIDDATRAELEARGDGGDGDDEDEGEDEE